MNNRKSEYEEYMDALDEEFEDTDNPEKPFRTEYAFEQETVTHSRFRRRNSDG